MEVRGASRPCALYDVMVRLLSEEFPPPTHPVVSGRPYLDFLPKGLSLPVNYSATELKELRGSNTLLRMVRAFFNSEFQLHIRSSFPPLLCVFLVLIVSSLFLG